MYQKVLLPIEPKQKEVEILESVRFVREMGAKEIHFLHVLNTGISSSKKIDNWLNKIVQRAQDGRIKLQTHLRVGHVATKICKAAVELNVDLIFHHVSYKGFFKRAFLGSVTMDVARMTDKTVLFHKSDININFSDGYKKIFYATDFGEGAKMAIPHVYSLGREKRELIVFHADKRAGDPISEQMRNEVVEEKLEELKGYFQKNYARVHGDRAVGVQANEISKRAEAEGSDLIVMGRFSLSPARKMLGSTSERVLANSSASILLVC